MLWEEGRHSAVVKEISTGENDCSLETLEFGSVLRKTGRMFADGVRETRVQLFMFWGLIKELDQ